jgi:hypothetical protein
MDSSILHGDRIVTQAFTKLQELEQAIANLPEVEFTAFAQWFEEFLADRWDRQIEEDFRAGRLDKLIQKAGEDFDAGRCTPL